jgi:hypothetical protein
MHIHLDDSRQYIFWHSLVIKYPTTALLPQILTVCGIVDKLGWPLHHTCSLEQLSIASFVREAKRNFALIVYLCCPQLLPSKLDFIS